MYTTLIRSVKVDVWHLPLVWRSENQNHFYPTLSVRAPALRSRRAAVKNGTSCATPLADLCPVRNVYPLETLPKELRPSRPQGVSPARDKAGMLPDRLNDTIRGFMPNCCILTALELDLFTAIGDGANVEEIGTWVHANARAVGMLLNALVALGLLLKTGDEYRNTPESARFFVRRSKDDQRNGLLHTANIWHRWSTLTAAVRQGTHIPIDGDRSREWTNNFIAGMQRNAKDRAPLVLKALGIAGVHRILDLGGGSGAYSIAFAKASPEVRCEILDLPEVVPLATEHVREAGVSAQVSLRPGDMLHDDFGSGYDIVMLKALSHGWR